MEIKDSSIWIALIILILMIGLTLYNIFNFMPIEQKCEPVFKVINECRCIPDENIAKMFGISNYVGKINLSIGENYENE